MNSIESLVEHLSTSENKQRLVSFFGIINDIVKKPQQVNIEENDDSSLVVFQKMVLFILMLQVGLSKHLEKIPFPFTEKLMEMLYINPKYLKFLIQHKVTMIVCRKHLFYLNDMMKVGMQLLMMKLLHKSKTSIPSI